MHAAINKGRQGAGEGAWGLARWSPPLWANDSRMGGVQGARQKDNGRVGDSLLGWRGEEKGPVQTKDWKSEIWIETKPDRNKG